MQTKPDATVTIALTDFDDLRDHNKELEDTIIKLEQAIITVFKITPDELFRQSDRIKGSELEVPMQKGMRPGRY
jgi:hypothetical protein